MTDKELGIASVMVIVWYASLIFILFMGIHLFMSTAKAHDAPHHDMWAQHSPKVQEWLRGQKQPGGPNKGQSCCDGRDGQEVQERIDTEGNYEVMFTTSCIKTERDPCVKIYGDGEPYWVKVPKEALLEDVPNLAGVPVAWYWHVNGKPTVRCYSPGAKL